MTSVNDEHKDQTGTGVSLLDAESPASTALRSPKIKGLVELAEIIAEHKADNLRVVLCHGVFDLLHIGHIRHFEEAKRLGHVLIVTVTSDRYVNKGPHRPAFPQILRAEAIAALNCVDYVATNDEPMAIGLIKHLQPNFYVKGSDYSDESKDITGGIQLEREAIESVGGKLAFTDDVVFSSSTLINRYLPVLPTGLNEYLESFASKHSATDIGEFFGKMKTLKVLAIGETIVDEYQYCQSIGKSSKEPMLAVKELENEKFAGGILAVANNIANFSDNAAVFSLLGDKNSELEFVEKNLNDNIKAEFVFRQNSPTIVKKRFIEKSTSSKLFEVYSINDSALETEDCTALCSKLEDLIPQFDIVLVVDFGHGMINEEIAEIICRRARFLAVNTQSNAGNLGFQSLEKYSYADLICLTETEARLELRDRQSDIAEIAERLAQKMSAERVIITRGERGCLCYSQSEGLFEVPALGTKVVDRMGAGDSFLSVVSLLAAQDAALEVLGFVGNAVGAQSVSTVGHREAISPVMLLKFISALLK